MEMNGRMGVRPWLAHTQVDYARLLLDRGERNDRGRAQDLLERAFSTYSELGMETFAANTIERRPPLRLVDRK
jgi:hypothetical protein